MFKRYAKQVRELIGALILLLLGIYIGQQLSEQERVQSTTSITAGMLASELTTDAAILQNWKMNRPSCARWLLELKVKSAKNTIKHLRADADRLKLNMADLEQVVEIGESALKADDKSQIDVGIACTQ